MHIFCTYGVWDDVGASASGGIIIQEKRCAICNKLKRRQTTYLGGSYNTPIPSRGYIFNESSESKKSTLPAKDVFLAGYHAAEDFFNCSSTEQEAEEHWNKYLDDQKIKGNVRE